MTAFDRIERRLPELLEELAAVSLPDYFDDMLQATAQSRQRPAWSALERWLPMGVIARPLPIRPIPWRLIAIVAALGLLAAAALVYVGTQRRVPAAVRPGGQRRAGHRHRRRRHRDDRSGDRRDEPHHRRPDASTAVPISRTTASGWSSTGSQPLHRASRRPRCSSPRPMDPTSTRSSRLRRFDWFDWSPSGDEALVTRAAGGKSTLTIVNVDDGSSNDLATDLDVAMAMSRPRHTTGCWSRPVHRTQPHVLAGQSRWVERVQLQTYRDAINEPTLSPDGTRFAYAHGRPTPRA